MAAKKLLRTITTPAKHQCTGSVIFLHGSGGTGLMTRNDLKYYLGEEFSFPHLQVHYPTAPMQPYTLNGGMLQNVWFDRLSLELNSPELVGSIDNMASTFDKLTEEEVNNGIPPDRIILGGFSMGGSFSLQLGYRFRRDLKGIFCLSSYLSEGSKVYEELKSSKGPFPPLFMAFGTEDDTVEFDWGQTTHSRLKNLGVDSLFHRYENMSHEMCREEVLSLKQWIEKLLPPL